jgi:hypothetical protein
MDVRICFRVRERKDVDLILGQGMLTVGWNAHMLSTPASSSSQPRSTILPGAPAPTSSPTRPSLRRPTATPTSARRWTRYRGKRPSQGTRDGSTRRQAIRWARQHRQLKP